MRREIKDITMQKKTEARRKGRALFLTVLALLALAGTLSAVSWYYYQDFSSQAGAESAGWTNFGTAGSGTHNISRDGLFFPTENAPYGGFNFNSPGVSTVVGGVLSLYGRPNNGDLAYNNIWTGKAVQFIPSNSTLGSNLSASPENPIGFMIVRTHAHIDPNNELQTATEYNQSAINVWLVQDQTLSSEWDNYANFVYFMELTKMNWTGNTDTSRLGFFDGSEHFPANAIGPDNSAYTGFTSGNWRINYDNGDGGGQNAINYGTAINQNNKPLAIRITHDGSKVRYYLNGNPIDGDGILEAEPNTFHYFGESSVSWNSNMKVMVGHETLYYLNESQSAQYTDFVIRTVCDTVTGSLTPQKVLASGTTRFTLTLDPTISGNDSGIGEVIIRKPTSYTGAWNLNTVAVSNAVSGSMTGLTRLTSGLPANRGQFRVMTNRTGDLKVLFRTATTSSGVISSGTANKKILVSFDLALPATANGSGDTFSAFVNLEKYEGFTYNILNLPTTGMKKATPATSESMLVRSYYQPASFASVTTSPSVINKGAVGEVSAQVVYEISTRGVANRPAISQAMIVIPTGFAVSNIQSLLIADDSANIQLTPSNTILLKYTDDSVGRLPSPDGYDRISFNIHGTPDIPDGQSNQQFAFSSKVDASAFVTGASWQSTTTNSTYPSQDVTVAAPDPQVQCHIFPGTLGNAFNVNTMTYTVNNMGNTYNKIKRLRILVDTSRITNVDNLTSSQGGAISYAAPYIFVDYTGVGLLGSGVSDTIGMRTAHNISDLNNPASSILFSAEVDNNNGKGYVAATAGSQGWQVTFMPPDPQGEAFVTPTEIWTSDILTAFTVSIYNNGPKGDKVYQALVAIPSIFTNVATAVVSSSLIGNPAYIVRTNISGVNYLWLRYNLAGTNIVSRNETEGVTPKDTVQLTLADNITFSTNRYAFDVYVDNKTNASFAGTHTVTNKCTVFSTNSLSFNLTYPPVMGSFDVQSRFTNTYTGSPVEQFHRIDASTSTNTVVVRLQNTGDYGNFIHTVYVYLPSEVISNVVASSWTSELVGTSGIGFVPPSGSDDGYVLVNYQAAGTNLSAGQEDTIRFRVVDHVSDNRYATFTVRAVNDRENAQVTNIISGFGNSASIEFFIPPARGAVSVLPRVFYTTGTAVETNTVIITVSNAGGGSNNLTKANIQYPSLYSGLVLSASNTFLGLDDSSAAITLGSTNITVNYTTVLPPGQVDRIYLRVRTTHAHLPLTRQDWKVFVDNSGTMGNDTQLISGASKSQWATQRPYLNVYETSPADHDVYTSNITNTVNVKFVNGMDGGSQSNWRFKLTVPEPFAMPFVSAVNNKSNSTANVTQNGREVIFNYSSPIGGFNFDVITLVLTDSFEEQETNTIWQAQVDYGDGIWLDVASNGLVGGTWFTNILSIVLPPATASVSLEPEYLYVDATSQIYTLTVLNTGIPGNHIRMLEVTPPVFITNISGVSNIRGPLSSVFTNGKLYLTYTGNRLFVGNQDVITFTGYDNITTSSGSAVPWSVRVANKADTNYLSGTTIASGKKLSTLVRFPEFRTEFSVTPTVVDTSVASNTYTLYIENKSPQTGAQDSYVQKAKVHFPAGILLTNAVSVTSSHASAVGISNSYIYLEYATALAPKSNDMVVIKMADAVEQGSTNGFWSVDVNYNTMGSTFTNANLMAGATNLLSFQMPNPQANASLHQREAYTSSSNVLLVYVLSNAGRGSNNLSKMWLDLPAALSGGVSLLSNSLGGTLAYSSGRISVAYTNFYPGLVDRVYFTAAHAISTITNYRLMSMVSNSTAQSNGVAVGLSDVLSFVTPPTARVSPTAVYTTVNSTNVQLYLYNNGSGVGSVFRVRVTIPEIYNIPVSGIESSRLGSISPPVGNTIELDYSGQVLKQGEDDVVTFSLADSFDHGYSNVRWQCEVDNGTGYASAAPESALALSNQFVMPAASASFHLLTDWIHASDTAGDFVTNTIQMVVSNTGNGSNGLYGVRVVLPEVLSNISSIVSSKGGTVSLTDSTNLNVDYTGDLLLVGERDILTFVLVDNVNNELTFTYDFYGDNDDGNGLVKLGDDRLSVYIKEAEPEIYIRGAKAPYIWETVTNTTIYTMDDAAVISFAVKNQSKRFGIEFLRIQLTDMYRVMAVTSQIAGNITATNRNATNLAITYPAGAHVGIQQTDVVDVYVRYDSASNASYVSNHQPITNYCLADYRYVSTSKEMRASSLNRDRLVLDNATFGRFLGRAIPGSSGATVTLKYNGSESLATNTDGATFNAGVSPTTGVYVIDKIPVGLGAYSLVVLPPAGETTTNNGVVSTPVNYQSVSVSNQNALANTLTMISNITLRYAKLNYQALGQQEVLCPEDPETKLTIPAGTLYAGVTVNISKETLTGPQQADALAGRVNQVPADETALVLYQFDLQDASEENINENGFKGDVTVTLHYDEVAIAAQGWQETDLAIYYWKASTGKWVRVGGYVDTDADTVTARVSYLHRYYAVMATAPQGSKPIRSVVASPNPFTPGRGGDEYGNLKLTFSFDRPYASYTVKIYNLRGRLIREIRGSGEFSQGSVFWDGKTEHGFFVRGGVYLYQIYAGSHVFTGSVLLLK